MLLCVNHVLNICQTPNRMTKIHKKLRWKDSSYVADDILNFKALLL